MTASRLSVYRHRTLVGHLERTRGGARFTYARDVVDAHAGLPVLSVALPVKARPYGEGLTNAWFSGLLPEGERLDRLARELGVNPFDYMGILAEVGWECAGALSIAPEESPAGFDGPEAREAAATPIGWRELGHRLANLPVYDQREGVQRVSVGGYQEKLCIVASDVRVEDGVVASAEVALPNAAAISTHIAKPQMTPRYPNLIEGEAWAMKAASHAARCAETALLMIDGAPATLLSKRFDRTAAGGETARVHQEDCCQALGLPPSRKYASVRAPKGDDPSYARIASALMGFSNDPDEELAELLRQMTVNLALGNADAHAKNYALLYDDGFNPRLSPLYDVAPVVDIEPKSGFLSLRVNGKAEADGVRRDDLVVEAVSWGMEGGLARETVSEALQNLGIGVERASACYPRAGALFAEPTMRRIERLLV